MPPFSQSIVFLILLSFFLFIHQGYCSGILRKSANFTPVQFIVF